jgi:hypothetical protein
MRFFYTCVSPYSFRRASSPLLLHLLQPRQPHARISIPLPKSYLFRQPLRLRILLSCLLDFALHLEELSKIVCRNCAAHIALFVALGRCDGGGLRERFCGPLARLFDEDSARGGVCDGEVGGGGGHCYCVV